MTAARSTPAKLRTAILKEHTDEFWAAVRALPGRQREAIALYYLADRSVAEIAATLGVAEGTVKGVLFDARRALAAKLGVREDWEES